MNDDTIAIKNAFLRNGFEFVRKPKIYFIKEAIVVPFFASGQSSIINVIKNIASCC